ncbi:alpha/beta fold hydrolase [Geodermatophilus marinus]|uniref:alpha/beta fold hydrolase n=1 Tax=Geodermatophilus sp. LHW52908 TaxID=2303986 RepID=UPI000E3E5C54|nr:alpha/beta hydrolase [Geodermatophilus sp. LHW52908]RFU22098.1 alpha/beta hydrolase [Geodermatophilus sp. LHW52908]
MTEPATVDGTPLAVTVRGPREAPPVVLVHGLGMYSRGWDDVAARLAREHRVIAYDLRGHGRSGDAGSAGYTLEAHGRDLLAVLEGCLDPGTRALVVGHSLGGGVLLAAARLAGTGRYAGAVFVGSGGSRVTAPGLPARRLPPRLAGALQSAWFAALRVGTAAGRRLRPVGWVSDRLVRRFGFAPGEPEELVERVRDDLLTTRSPALSATTLASLSHDGTGLARHLDVPALVLHGTRDPEVLEEDLRALLTALPDAELVSYPGAGHFLPLTHGPQVAADVARWAALVRPG